MVSLINVDAAEYYRTIVVYHQGKAVASGCINITRAPISNKEPFESMIDDDELDFSENKEWTDAARYH